MDKSGFPIKSRYIVAVWLIPFFYLPGVDYFYRLLDEYSEWYWFHLVYYYYYQTLFAALLAILVMCYKINWRRMFARPKVTDYFPAINLTAWVFIFSIAAAYAIFYPLSFVIPEFVYFWYLDLPAAVYGSEGYFPILPNLLSLISLVVLAPITEEFAFRGLLLHRWGQKLGVNKAILLSSLLFGVVHPDPIGATVFGIAMCVIYLKTQSLLVPILCHALTNLVAWIWELGYFLEFGFDEVHSMEEFQADWFFGLTCAAIAGVWATLYLRGAKSQKVWKLPDV